jgi:threonine dehydratase
VSDATNARATAPHAAAAPPRVTLDGIRRARAHVAPAYLDSPQLRSAPLDDALGAALVLKVETLNPVRSFKGRGADWFVASLAAEARAHGGPAPHVVCASAGNFGQGIAEAARRRGARATVYAAHSANPLKLDRMRALGAEVRLAGDDFDAAKAAAREAAAALGVPFVEDGRELAVTEGAGTMGLELARWPEPLDVVLVPLGNGALLAGVGHALRALSPRTRLVAVCAAGAPAMARSLHEGRAVETARVDTIADGIAVRVPVPEALDDLRGVVDEVVLVEDAVVVEAMRLVHRHVGVVVEPAGAVGVAAALARPDLVRGAVAATPLCGGNLTPEQIDRWL